MNLKEMIQSGLYNIYGLIDRKGADTRLEAIYDEKGLEGADRLSVAEIKSMSFKQFLETKANEAMSTGQAGFGGNFVNSEVLVQTILDSVRDRQTLLSYIANQRTMQNPIEAIPVE
jgi:hypothetical protein